MPVLLDNPWFLWVWLAIPLNWWLFAKNRHRFNNARQRGSVSLIRSALILCLGLALAGPRINQTTDKVSLVFSLDMSSSVQTTSLDQARDFIERAAIAKKREDEIGLVVFGKDASVESLLTKNPKLGEIRSRVNGDYSNLYAGLQAALGQVPQKTISRIILISDGNENVQNAIEMAYLAKSMGVQIVSLPFVKEDNENEVIIEKLDTPSTVQMESPFEISLIVRGTLETQAELIMMKDNQPFIHESITLTPGLNRFTVVDTITNQGLHLYKAIINTDSDTLFQNNEGLSFTRALQKSAILYLSEKAPTPPPMASAMADQGFAVKLVRPESLPVTLNMLLDYSAIILDDVSSVSLSLTGMSLLESYVRDMGGGLIMIGGKNGFGAGYYSKSPVENALPVFMDIPTTVEIPSLSLFLLLDRSSSMSGQIGEKSKLEGAKIAAFSAVELLNPIDKVGILAFDEEPRWVVPVTRAENRKEIAEKLSSITADGGTNLHPALKIAHTELNKIKAVKKHVLILSDGRTKEYDFTTLVTSMRKDRITVSTVGIGKDADAKLLSKIAADGNGRYYHTNDIGLIPRIFVDETRIVASNVVLERVLTPQVTGKHEIIDGLPLDPPPMITGLDQTYPKPDAEVILNTPDGPLLAIWRYGLGRSLAFTSDMAGRWSKEWLSMDWFGTLIARMVRWTQKKETDQNHQISIRQMGIEGVFEVDIIDRYNRFVNGLDLRLKVISPDSQDNTIGLIQTAPGKYQAEFPTENAGEYYLNLYRNTGEETILEKTAGYGLAYSAEFDQKGTNLDLLNQLSEITGGWVATFDDNPEDLYTIDQQKYLAGFALWPLLLLASAILLVLEVALRKIYNLSRQADKYD